MSDDQYRVHIAAWKIGWVWYALCGTKTDAAPTARGSGVVSPGHVTPANICIGCLGKLPDHVLEHSVDELVGEE